MKLYVAISVALSSLCFFNCRVAKSVDVIEAYGDSITAGFLSATNLTHPPPLRAPGNQLSISRVLTDMLKYTGSRNHNPAILARDHAPQLAWPAVLARKEAEGGTIPPVMNAAVSGAVVDDLWQQVTTAPPNSYPTQAFFYIGHNDLRATPLSPNALAQYYFEKYSQALMYWDKHHTGSDAYLLPLAQIQKVFELLFGYVWYRSPRMAFTCNASWNSYFIYASTHYHRYLKGTLAAYIVPRVDAMNQALSVLAEQMELSSHGRNHFHYVDHLYDEPLRPEYFAVDCYHLSAEGQKEFAQTVFERLHQ